MNDHRFWKGKSTICWSCMGLAMEQKKFHNFPEVICVDTVSHTNKDKCPLLTISGKDSYGKNVYDSEGLFTK